MVGYRRGRGARERFGPGRLVEFADRPDFGKLVCFDSFEVFNRVDPMFQELFVCFCVVSDSWEAGDVIVVVKCVVFLPLCDPF